MKRNETNLTKALAMLALSACVLVVTGCTPSSDDAPVEPGTKPPFVASGDLPQILESGKLRFLYVKPLVDTPLPRDGMTLEFELDLVKRFARQHGLTPVPIFVNSHDRLIESLLEGNGDLIAGNLTATPERKQVVSFTVPVRIVREQLVARSDDFSLHEVSDLEGRRVAVRPSSSYRQTLESLRQDHPGIVIHEVPEAWDTQKILDRVGKGVLDVAVADSSLVENFLGHRRDVRAAFNLTGDRPVAWAVRPESQELLRSLNLFLTKYRLTEPSPAKFLGDLPLIRKRKTLRVLTQNSAASYFLWKGQLLGFEYDLAKRFAQRQKLRLEMVVPPPGEDLLVWLQEGRGDIVAAAMTPTEARRAAGNAFSRPYNTVSQVVVTRMIAPPLEGVDDLDGRTFHVRRNSSYWETLERLQATLAAEGKQFELVEVPPEMGTAQVIGKVASGEYDLTLADSHILDIELTWRDNIRGAFAIGDTVDLCWAVRETNPELLATINDFIRREFRGLFYNVKYDQYFRNAARMRSHAEGYGDTLGGLSPYDEIIQRYATEHDFDWRMVVAQMYTESRFDPDAHSFAGALGLMQVLPRTAEELGITGDLRDPETGIRAGIEYLAWVRERFAPDLSIRDRMWFTLAAYNAGPGHVRDARRLAGQLGLNPNRWTGNVEEAMMRLSSPKYYRNAPHGYCRCSQAVSYVRNIRQQYRIYVDSTERVAIVSQL